jgi:hypothetical protein
MMKMGLPKDAVRNALQRDGKDPAIADLDPDQSLEAQTTRISSSNYASDDTASVSKVAIRRKKIYWNSLDRSKINPGSMWEQVVGMVDMKTLKYDSVEFENLFTEPINNHAKQKSNCPSDHGKGATDNLKQKKSVQVIEGKRGMNGGIALARIKKKYEEVASIIDRM